MGSSVARVRRLATLLVALGLIVLAAQPVDASAMKFGSKLANGIDPSNSPNLCDHELNGGSGTYACTWILLTPYNGGLTTAPANGHIVKIKLIAWHSGSLTVFLAQKSGSKYKVVTKGPKIKYHDGCPSSCSIQTYNISPLAVSSGQYLAVQGANMGPLRCDSGGNKIALFKPPMVVGGGFRTPTGFSGCYLMVQAVYG